MLYEDKRNFFRMLVNTEAQLVILDSEAGRKIDGVCRDLSATGMSIEIDEPLEVETQVKIRIDATNNSIPSLDALARVVRCTEVDEQEYLLGLEVLELN